ncbi:hypothetical protein [Actinoplanes sp. NPDC026670]|uniref:nSTAND1 domain-containing NTPase n=1 Tax=Actinoplanes sp. NPDC026670 TaxID=3154700 RepID=UPI0033D82E97
MDGESEAVQRSKSGIRSWVRTAGSGLRRAGPYGILAFLTASAVAPVAGAALGVPAAFAVVLGQLGGMGSNYLADVLAGTATQLTDGTEEPSEEQWREAIAADLLARLEAGDTGLRDELTGLLHAIGAVEVALLASDDQVRELLAEGFGQLRELAADTRRVLDDIRRGLAEQAQAQRRDTGRVLGALAATTALVRSLRRADEPTEPEMPAPDDGVVPYPGLSGFGVEDAAFFYGRDDLVQTLLARLDEHLLGGPPVLLVGASGAGKSSLLHAGLYPAVASGGLDEVGEPWPWVFLTPGETPLATLHAELHVPGDGPAPRRVIVVDQFEELFTQCTDPGERAAFVTALAGLEQDLLIIAVRADFYAQCIELAPMAALLGHGQVVVGPPSIEQLRQVITAPAQVTGLAVEPGLTEVLLRDYRPGALPLLAHALRATWHRREGDILTIAGYHRTGGIGRAVAETAEGVWSGLSEPGRAAVRSALLGLVTDVDGQPVRRRATRTDVDMEVLGRFVTQRLITVDGDTVQISHEALLDSWPRLAGWLRDAREEILVRQRLGQAAREWADGGEDPDALWQGVRLAAAQQWTAGNGGLPPAQQRFLDASAAAADARLAVQRRTTRRLRRLAAGLTAALLLVAAGALVAWDQRGQARSNWYLAQSRQQAAESHTEHHVQPLSAVDKALAAWASAPTVEARSALLHAQHTLLAGRLGTRTGANSIALSPDGRTAAVGYFDGEIQLWDTTTQQPLGSPLHHPTGMMGYLRFSPDGRYLASSSFDPTGVAVWDLPTGKLRHRLPGWGAIAWLPDSTAILAALGTGTSAIGEWDPGTGRRLATTPVPQAGPGLAVSARGDHMAVGSASGGVLVRRPDGTVLTTLPDAYHVGFTADDTLFTTGMDNGSKVQIRRSDDRWRPQTVPDPSGELNPAPASGFAITPGGTVIKASGNVGEILRLQAGTPRTSINGLRGVAAGFGLSGDAQLLGVVSEADAPTLFRIGGTALPHPQVISQLAVDPSGGLVATGTSDDKVRIWDPQTGVLRSTIALGGDNEPIGLGYGPDGSLAVTVNDGSRILLYDTREQLEHTFTVDRSLVAFSPAFSPDGSLLAVTASPRAVYDNGPDAPSYEDLQQRTDPDVIVFDTRTHTVRAVLRLPGHLPMSVAFSQDSTHLLATANRVAEPGRSTQAGSVWRFRVSDLTLIDSREIPEGPVDELAISPDSATVAVTADTAVRLLRIDGLTPQSDLAHQSAPVERITWSPDGQTLATATDTNDGLIQLWNPNTTRLIAQVRGNSNQSGPLQFSPDSRLLFAGLQDFTVGIWRLDPGEAITRLCGGTSPARRAAGQPLAQPCR